MVFFFLAIVVGIILAHFFAKDKKGAVAVLLISFLFVGIGAYITIDAYDEPTIFDVKQIDYLIKGSEEMGFIYAYDSYCYADGEIIECISYRCTEDKPVRFEKSESDGAYVVIYETALRKKWEWANFGLKERYEYVFVAPNELFPEDE